MSNGHKNDSERVEGRKLVGVGYRNKAKRERKYTYTLEQRRKGGKKVN